MILIISRVVRSIEADVGLDAVGARSRALLKHIGEENALGSAPRIVDVVAQSGFGSVPTIYASLDELVKGGWIVRRPDPSDGRVRRVYLTPQAQKVFARMSREVAKILLNSRSRSRTQSEE